LGAPTKNQPFIFCFSFHVITTTPAGYLLVRRRRNGYHLHSSFLINNSLPTPIMTNKREAKEGDTVVSDARSEKKQKLDTTVLVDTSTTPSDDDPLKDLEAVYQTASEAYKKDKSDKDLRRAKSAAKKARDAAVLTVSEQDGGGQQLQSEEKQELATAVVVDVDVAVTETTSTTPSDDDTVKGFEAVYRKASEAFKKDKSDKAFVELRRAKNAVKKARKEKLDPAVVVAVVDTTAPSDDDAVKNLETVYRKALEDFKKDKSDKDLRRAKSAAKKAWDAAVLAAAQQKGGGQQLQCKDCSQMFVFSAGEQDFYAETCGFKSQPKRCRNCNESHKARIWDRSKRDKKGKNMCLEFSSKGECKWGDSCKFSHHGRDNPLSLSRPKPDETENAKSN
jgi:hypothetical protein